MNKFLILFPLLLLATVPQAQQSKNRLGLVNVQAVVKGMSGSSAYLGLLGRVDADLKAKQANIQKLATKAAATRSAADRTALTKAQQAYATAQVNHQKRLDSEFKPLATKMNAAVAKVAKANGFSVVLDYRAAAQSQLVVYAHSGADLTSQVQKALK